MIHHPRCNTKPILCGSLTNTSFILFLLLKPTSTLTAFPQSQRLADCDKSPSNFCIRTKVKLYKWVFSDKNMESYLFESENGLTLARIRITQKNHFIIINGLKLIQTLRANLLSLAHPKHTLVNLVVIEIWMHFWWRWNCLWRLILITCRPVGCLPARYFMSKFVRFSPFSKLQLL